MKDAFKITFILFAGIFLSAAPYLPANPTTQAMLAAVAKKRGAAAPTYLIDQDCEGVGTPTTPVAWSDSGTVAWDVVSPVLDGECVSVTGDGGTDRTQVNMTAGDTRYGYFMFRMEETPTLTRDLSIIFDSGFAVLATMSVTATQFQVTAGGGTSATTVATIRADTNYHVWWDYTKGTGSNATINLYFSTTTTKPGAGDYKVTSSNGTTTTQPLYFHCRCGTQTSPQMIMYFDNIKIDDEDIGSNPP